MVSPGHALPSGAAREHTSPRPHAGERRPHSADRFGHVADGRCHRRAGGADRGRVGLPADRHRGELRERAWRRPRAARLRRATRGAVRHHQVQQAVAQRRRRQAGMRGEPRAPRPRLPRPVPRPLAEPGPGPLRRRLPRTGRAAARRPVACGRHLELHARAPAAGDRRDRGDPGGQPAAAQPVRRAGEGAGLRRPARHRGPVVVAAGSGARAALRARGQRAGAAVRAHPRPDPAAVAHRARAGAGAEVGGPAAAAREHRGVRLHAHAEDVARLSALDRGDELVLDPETFGH